MQALRSAYGQGFVTGVPFVIVVAPFALLFGVAATEAGLAVSETMAMSVLVIAGASQFTALQLMQDGAPVLVVLGASLAVNLRMAMYSAALVPHLGAVPFWQRAFAAYLLVDQSYLVSIRRFEAEPEMTTAAKLRYFLGAVSPLIPVWYACTWAGAVAGAAIPPGTARDFAVPITFLALIAPALRALPHLGAAAVSALLALVFAGLPAGLGLMLAALAAIATGALLETWLERRT